mmetsp:Transcript_6810/g.15269  ORF Transcript_6810/g.15269 Transcript_6810/m.15269 type:complete len:80 (-) Transcript_6810:293-532(-)
MMPRAAATLREEEGCRMWGGAMHAAADGRKGGVVGDEFMSLVREVQFRARFVVDSVLGVGGCPWCPGESMREVSLHAKV